MCQIKRKSWIESISNSNKKMMQKTIKTKINSRKKYFFFSFFLWRLCSCFIKISLILCNETSVTPVIWQEYADQPEDPHEQSTDQKRRQVKSKDRHPDAAAEIHRRYKFILIFWIICRASSSSPTAETVAVRGDSCQWSCWSLRCVNRLYLIREVDLTVVEVATAEHGYSDW